MWVSSSRGARRRQSHASSRRHGNPAFQHCLIGAATMAAGLLLSAPVFADDGQIYVKQLSAPSIKVIGNGAIYTQVEDGTDDVVVHVRILLDAGTVGRVKTWSAWAQGKMSSGQWFDFKDNGLTVSYPVGSRPKTVDRDEALVIPRSAYSALAADACNQNAADLRADGMSNFDIFGSDHLVKVPVRGALTYEMSGAAGGIVPPQEAALDPELMVTCAKIEFGPLTTLTLNQVADSALAIAVTSNISVCRLNAAGSITSLHPNETVSFRYVDDKGEKSGVKTVTTSAAKIANFTHQLPLTDDGGAMSGKIRMVGESSNFQSPWVDYAVTCNATAAPGGKTTELPPTIEILEAETKKEVVLGERWSCPSRIWVRGQVSGRAQGAATVQLFGNDSLLEIRQFDLEAGSEEKFAAGHDISWHGVSAASETAPNQLVIYRAIVRANEGTADVFVADEDENELRLICHPIWPEPSIKVKVVESVPVGGRFLCPSRYQVIGNLVGRSDVSGTVVLFAEHKSFGPVPFALNEGVNLDIVAPSERTLAWKGVGLVSAVGPQPTPEQKIHLSMQVYGSSGSTLEIISKDEVMRCTPVAGVVPDSSAQLPGNPQVGLPASAVQVAGGKVRLVGAKPGAIYALRFYRMKLVTDPYLPTKMANGVANLNLAKMKPGQWRVEVCATRNGRGLQILPNTCRERRFEVKHAAPGGPGKHMQEPKPDNSTVFPGGNPWQ